MNLKQNKKVILLILDGWGHREEAVHNAIKEACPVNFLSLLDKDPHILIEASGEYVGLPDGQMGNSEVGHTNLGAGRVVYQDLVKIKKSISSGEAADNLQFNNFINTVKKGTGRLHVYGLLSDGGVHSHIEHIKGIMKLASQKGIKEIYLHAVMDGRDTPPKSGIEYITDVTDWMKQENIGEFADICGRFYSMDRDKRWDREEKAYRLMRFGEGEKFALASEAIKSAYEKGITDEFVEPSLINENGIIKDGDGVFFVNFRADRMREMLSIFCEDNFSGFNRGAKPQVSIITMTKYLDGIDVPVMYVKQELKNLLGEVVSKAGLTQLRIAETEKYAHVTYFFNGGNEAPYRNEERILVASPRDVATYDLKPEMSVAEITEKFELAFKSGGIDFVVMNFANPDMVGHTGVENAAVAACRKVDEMLGKVIKVADETGAVLFVTADHGNSETMWDYENNQPHTAHTTNPVWFIMHNGTGDFIENRGKLADVAPTILKVFGIEKPDDMTGEYLI